MRRTIEAGEKHEPYRVISSSGEVLLQGLSAKEGTTTVEDYGYLYMSQPCGNIYEHGHPDRGHPVIERMHSLGDIAVAIIIGEREHRLYSISGITTLSLPDLLLFRNSGTIDIEDRRKEYQIANAEAHNLLGDMKVMTTLAVMKHKKLVYEYDDIYAKFLEDVTNRTGITFEFQPYSQL